MSAKIKEFGELLGIVMLSLIGLVLGVVAFVGMMLLPGVFLAGLIGIPAWIIKLIFG